MVVYSDNKNVAIFIDAENIPSKYAKDIFEYASSYGNVIIKRIYADWSKQNVISWKDEIFNYSITAMQQFSSNSNKNSSDMYLATEALSIFYEKEIDVFIIVSSDSDYTSLVQKLRENKKKLVGIGFENASVKYKNSFDKFLFLRQTTNDVSFIKNLTKEHIDSLLEIIGTLVKEKSKASYSSINNRMLQKHRNFSVKKCGFSSFKLFMESFLTLEQCGIYKLIVSKGGDYYLVLKEDLNDSVGDDGYVLDDYMVSFLDELLAKKDKALPATLARKMRKALPGFSAKEYGFSSFIELLNGFLDSDMGKAYRQVLDESANKRYIVKSVINQDKSATKNDKKQDMLPKQNQIKQSQASRPKQENQAKQTNEISSNDKLNNQAKPKDKSNLSTQVTISSGEVAHVLEFLDEVFATNDSIYYPYLVRRLKQIYHNLNKGAEGLRVNDFMDVFLSTEQGKIYHKILKQNNKMYLVKKETLLLNP